MIKVAIIYILALILCLLPIKAFSYDYDVDMPGSDDPKFELITITIDKCESKFYIKKSDFESFSKDQKMMQSLTDRAIHKSLSGCRSISETK